RRNTGRGKCGCFLTAMALVCSANACFGHAPGYHQFFDTGCRANSTALGHTPLHLLAEFYSHVSRDLVSPLVVPSTFRCHCFACRPGIISRRRHSTYIADRGLSVVSLCRLHGLPWCSRAPVASRP